MTTTFLQAFAEIVPGTPKGHGAQAASNQLSVTLKIIKDLNDITEKIYLLPAPDKSAFTALPTELFIVDPDSPDFITRKDFKAKFIDHTLGLLGQLQSINEDKLNDHYDDIFSLEHEKATAAVTKLIYKQQGDIDSLVKSFTDESKENLEAYEAKLTDETQNKIYGAPPEIKPGPKPSTPTSQPVTTQDNMSELDKKNLKNMAPELAINHKGIQRDRQIEGIPEVNLYPGDKSIIGENNSGVIFGRDEIFGLQGHTKSGAVYLYAGRSPHNIQVEKKDSTTGVGANTALKINNNLVEDAAYLYLSQKAKSGELLLVSEGTYGKVAGERVGQSLAALKADDIVLMARKSGIRLIAATDVKDTQGKDITAKFGIDLLTGNDAEGLQPLIKGNNLVKYLKVLSKSVDDLQSVVYTFLTSQISMNAALTNHQHYDPFCIFLGLMTTGSPISVNGGKNFLSTEVAAAGYKALLEATIQQKGAIMQFMSRDANDKNAFEGYGDYRIRSAYNKTN